MTDNLAKFAFPLIKKAYPRIMAQDIVSVQPMDFALYAGSTYWAKHVDECWQTCTQKDLYDPDYIPHFGIAIDGGYAIWDSDFKPIVCTDREIFEKHDLQPEEAKVTDESISLANPRRKLNSKIFFMNYKATRSIGHGIIGAKPPEEV